jgi:hypothetical protein
VADATAEIGPEGARPLVEALSPEHAAGLAAQLGGDGTARLVSAAGVVIGYCVM